MHTFTYEHYRTWQDRATVTALHNAVRAYDVAGDILASAVANRLLASQHAMRYHRIVGGTFLFRGFPITNKCYNFHLAFSFKYVHIFVTAFAIATFLPLNFG